MENRVILVDENDRKIGEAEKMQAHIDGNLHRAFSIFVFNSNGKTLLQKRAKTKYHSASLWSNTCCSHPKPGEVLENAVRRRLLEEMGFECQPVKVFSFRYKIEFNNKLIEHEYDHVFVGYFDGNPVPNQNEVDACKWVDIGAILSELRINSEKYTYWFKIAFLRLLSQLKKINTITFQ